MPISAIDGSTQVYELDTATGPQSTWNIPVPTSGGALVEGDLIIAAISFDTNNTTPPTITPPAGWTIQVPSTIAGTSSTTVAHASMYHFITAAEVASPPSTWTFTLNAAYDGTVSAGRFRGVNSADPFAVSSPAAKYSIQVHGTAVAAKVAPAVTTTVADTYLVTGAAHRSGSQALASGSPTTGYTLLASAWGVGGRASGLAYKLQSAAGASTTATWTQATGTGVGIAWQTALNPTSAAPTAPTVNAGADANHTVNTAFSRTATESANGSAITSRSWTIVSGPSGAGSTIGTAAALSWTPTVTGTYVLRYSATNTAGTSTDDATITVQSAAFVGSLTARVVDVPSGGSQSVAVRTTSVNSVRLKVGTDSAVTANVVYSPAVTPSGQGFSMPTVTGLSPGKYYFRIEMTDTGGVVGLDTGSVGEFYSVATGTPANFAWTMSACCDATDSASMTAIAARDDQLFIHMGDLYYNDLRANALSDFRAEMLAKVQVANHSAVFSTTNTVYTPSDHDGMADDSTAGNDATAWTNWNAAYREHFGQTGIPATTGVYRTFVIGRIRFMILDTRSFASNPTAADNSSKTRLGTTQKTWLKDTITAATEPVIIIVQDTVWHGTADAVSDDWRGHLTERDELATFFNTRRTATGQVFGMLGGDQHAVAADDGTNVPGLDFMFMAAPLNNSASQKGGNFSHGRYPTSGTAVVQQYGRVVVTDTGTQITLAFNGYSSDNTSRVNLTETKTTTVTITGRVLDKWNGSSLVRQIEQKWNSTVLVTQVIEP